MLPFFQEVFCFLEDNLAPDDQTMFSCIDNEEPISNLLLARILDVLVCFEQVTDVNGLPPPKLSVNSPIQRQFQCSPIKRPASLATLQLQ